MYRNKQKVLRSFTYPWVFWQNDLVFCKSFYWFRFREVVFFCRVMSQ